MKSDEIMKKSPHQLGIKGNDKLRIDFHEPKIEAVLFAISVLNWVFTYVIQSPRFTNDYKFGISVNTYQ